MSYNSPELQDLGDNNRTGNTCHVAGRWCCKDHPSVEKSVRKDEFFPKCDHAGGHDTKWLYVKY
ncbi:MAG: hypothetical protein V2I54_06880 [Bacteroidales bacterium]|jgi:hypothetical protein|nr:hypothetical protein [Bacteroidales bacterium]